VHFELKPLDPPAWMWVGSIALPPQSTALLTMPLTFAVQFEDVPK
jgi:hypothetical protein